MDGLDAAFWRALARSVLVGASVAGVSLVAGWPLSRVQETSDSLWNADLPEHRRELQTCMSKRDMNLSSCLTLYYKWESDRALATADSIARVRLGGRP